MGRGSQRKRRAAAARRAAARRTEAAAELEQVQAQALALAQARLDRLYDPATPVGEIAELVWEQYDGEPVLVGLANLLARKGSTGDRLAQIADALDEHGAATLTTFTFRALVAREHGDQALADRLVDAALEQTSDADVRVRLASHLHWHGRIGEALCMLREHLADLPDDDWAVEKYGVTLEAAHADTSQVAEEARRRDEELARFGDRDGLYALRAAVEQYVPRSRYAAPVAEHVQEWLDTAEPDGAQLLDAPDDDLSQQDDQLVRLAIEHALVAGSRSDDPADCALAAYAADPDTPPELAAHARTWFDHARYGLWQISDPHPNPGLWCCDVLTGTLRYAQFAPEQTEQLPRWATLLGLLVPLDGAWRSAGAAIQLSPAEADAVYETIRAAAESIVDADLAQRRARKSRRRLHRPIPFGQADPHAVLGELDDPSPPVVASLLSTITGVLLPRILAELRNYRATPPRLNNTDGEPMCLITAQIRVADPDAVVAHLGQHPDFRTDDEHQQLSWLGKPVPPAQRESMLAELRAQLAAEGHQPELLDSDDEQRWVRGQIARAGDTLTVTVNSTQRLERLLNLLTDAGAQPEIIDQTRIDPIQDLPWPAGRRLTAATLAPPEQGWEKHWLDEPVPALRGDTPRQAANGEHRAHLETLLREFEYDHDQAGSAGGPDTSWLREQLNLPGPDQD
jgi:hypothetical protein